MAVPDTLRGFRTQFLYTLFRVVTDNQPEYVYVPEGLEDLDIKQGDKVLEVIQVKNLKSALSYGNLQSPGKQTSFFVRGEAILAENPTAILKVTSFGPIGSQLTDDIKLKKALRKDSKVSNQSIHSLASSFLCEDVNEDDLYDTILNILKSDFPAFNGEWEIRYLLQWIYELAEKQETVTLEQLHNQLLSLREVEARQASSQAQLGIRVKRLFKDQSADVVVSSLKDEYLEGVSARPDHIQAEVDIRRQKWLNQIDQAFGSRNIMIVHGISGQGKSSLCYRYIKDYESFAFQICDCVPETLAAIKATVKEISSSLQTHVLVYFDVQPGEYTWPKLVKEFADNPHIRILVSIREEDWQTSKHVINEIASYNETNLSLSKDEAFQIFKAYDPDSHKNVFVDKWEELGESAPLLEFVFSITHGETLKSKLTNQYRNLSRTQKRIISSIIVPLYLGGTPTEETISAIDIDPISIAEEYPTLEGEYFIKDGTSYRDVHPVRTLILKEIICNGASEFLISTGLYYLGRLPIKDCSRYIVHLFQEGMDTEKLFRRLDEFDSMPAQLCFEVFKGLLWKGCQNYVIENESLIDDLRNVIGGFWSWMLPINYTEIELEETIQGVFKNFMGIYVSAKEISDRMGHQGHLFKYIEQWLRRHVIKISPLQKKEYSCLGMLLYLLNLEQLSSYIDTQDISVVPVESLECRDYAHLLLGLKSSRTHINDWSILENMFLRNLRKEYLVYSLVMGENDIESQILIDMRNGFEDNGSASNVPAGASRFINNRVVTVCELLRMAFPDKTKYSCMLEAGDIGEIMIDRVKTISRKSLPIDLMRIPRRMVCQIYENNHRPENKRMYFEQTICARKHYVSFSALLKGIFKKWIRGEQLSSKTLVRFQMMMEEMRSMPAIELPASLFDPTYIQEEEEKQALKIDVTAVKNYSSTFDKYSTAISNFFYQFIDALKFDCTNHFPANYNLIEAIKECHNLSSLTAVLGNPYSEEKVIDNLLKQEKETLNKLWIYWNFISKHPRRQSTVKKVEFEWRVRQKSLPVKFSKDLKESFESLGFMASVEIKDRTLYVKLKYDNMAVYQYLAKSMCYAIKESLSNYEYLSTEYVMLTQQIDTIKLSESFEFDGKEYCISGLTWSITMHDAFIMNESNDPLLFIKGEKSYLNSEIEELYLLEKLQGVILNLSLTASQIQSATLNRNPSDSEGSEIINYLNACYQGLGMDLISQVKAVKDSLDIIEDHDVVDEVSELCNKIENLCVDGLWLNSRSQLTQIAQDIESISLGYKTLVFIDYIQRHNRMS